MIFRRKFLLAAAALLVLAAAALLLRDVVHRVRLAAFLQEMRSSEAAFHGSLSRTLDLASEAIGPDGRVAASSTCHGGDHSPAIGWKNVPNGTRSLVVMMVDADAGTPRPNVWAFTHWILFDIPAAAAGLPADLSIGDLQAQDIRTGRNSMGGHEYVGPCPDPQTHHYLIRAYALDLPRLDPDAVDRPGINAAMKGHILAYGELAAIAGPSAMPR